MRFNLVSEAEPAGSGRPHLLPSKARFSLNELAKHLDVHASTVWRWTLRGIRGRKLKTIQIGGRRFVFAEEAERFISSLNQPDDSPAATEPANTRRGEMVEKLLDREDSRSANQS